MLSDSLNLRKIVLMALTLAVSMPALVLAPATADSPSDPKRLALDVVERNAEQIAVLGDVL